MAFFSCRLNEGNYWRIKTNEELDRWRRYCVDVVGVCEKYKKRILCGKMLGVRKQGRPKKRWKQNVEDNLKELNVIKW